MAQPSFFALRQPVFRAYFFGAASAMMADSIEHVITYWIAFQKFHSPTLGGFAMLSHWLPFLLFSTLSGALADRFDPTIRVGDNSLSIWNNAADLFVPEAVVNDTVGPGTASENERPEHCASVLRIFGQFEGVTGRPIESLCKYAPSLDSDTSGG